MGDGLQPHQKDVRTVVSSDPSPTPGVIFSDYDYSQGGSLATALRDRNIVITGSGRAKYTKEDDSPYALTGIGDEIATASVQCGAAGVVLHSYEQEIDPRRIEWLRTQSKCAASIDYISADFALENSGPQLVETAWRLSRGFDTLVLAAGIYDEPSALDVTPEVFRRTLQINTETPFFAAQRFVQLVRDGKNSGSIDPERVFRIIAISSINADMGEDRHPSYDASKAGLIRSLISLCTEVYHPYKVRLATISPGLHVTPLTIRDINSNDYLRRIQDGLIPGGLTNAYPVAQSVLGALMGFNDFSFGAAIHAGGGISTVQPSASRVASYLEKL